MRITVATQPARIADSDSLVLIHGDMVPHLGALSPVCREEFRRFRHDVEEGGVKSPRTLVLRDGKSRLCLCMTSTTFHSRFPEVERLKIAAAEASRIARNGGSAGKIHFCLPAGRRSAGAAAAIAEGLVLGSYHFTRFRPQADRGLGSSPSAARLVTQPSDRTAVGKAVKRAVAVAESVNAARELANAPGRRLVPADLARHARRVARAAGLQCQALDEKALAREGYNGLLTVGAGSDYPPRMVILRHRPARASQSSHLCFLGKGITFDTGGICLKPAEKMWEMKADMAGAAAVLHAMEAIARLALPIRVTAVLVAAENTPGPRATLPGEVFTARSGKTVHVINTDAEGRLILTDALHRAGEEKATAVVDVATLTGAIVRAIGPSLTGLMSNDPSLAQRLKEAGAASGEDFCELPLYEEYRDLLKSDVADISNTSSSKNGGAITAALFLSEFVPVDTVWAHLDIAGAAFRDEKWKYFEPGATGAMVRTLVRLAESFAGKP